MTPWPLALAGVVLVCVALLPVVLAAAAPGWTAVVNLSKPGGGALGPQIAVDGRGDAVAVWYRSAGAKSVIQSAAIAASGRWQAPVNLSTPDRKARKPQVAIDSAGNAVAVWERYTRTSYVIQGALREAGGSWQAPADLSVASHFAGQPQVAMDPQGDAVAIWFRSNDNPAHLGGDAIIQAAMRPAGSSAWQAPVDLSAAGQSAYNPQVAMDERGDVVAIWSRSDGGDPSHAIIQSAIRPAGASAWETPVNLSAAGHNAGTPQVAISSRGDAVAVWRREDGIAQAALRPAGGSWQAPLNVSIRGEKAFAPQVAIDSRGTAVAVWRSFDGKTNVIRAAVRPAGGSWRVPVKLSVARKSGRAPQVAMGPNGKAVVVWDGSNGRKLLVQAAVRAMGGRWRGPVDLSAPVPWPAEFSPQVGVDAQGDAIAIWYQAKGAGTVIQARATGPH